jgi:uncharacterized protein YpmB
MMMSYLNMSKKKISSSAHQAYDKLTENADISTVDKFVDYFLSKQKETNPVDIC